MAHNNNVGDMMLLESSLSFLVIFSIGCYYGCHDDGVYIFYSIGEYLYLLDAVATLVQVFHF